MKGSSESGQEDAAASSENDAEKPASNQGATSNDPIVGQTIDGKYKVLSVIGRGGMGSVYKAEHVLIKRIVAVKILRVQDPDSMDEFLRRFEQEARTASKIHHPSAITIYDYGIAEFGTEGEMPYLVMEFIQGNTLKEMNQEAPIPVERLVGILVQVCGALEEAHTLGIVHRDLKPDNIMVSKRSDGSDWAHVLDFGIAKILTEKEENVGMTQTGHIIGTPRYMAPEQVLSEQVTFRTDIYALGVILYELITGKPLFDSTTSVELAIKHASEEPEPMLVRNPNAPISKTFDKAVLKALSKAPDDRHESARHFAEDILRACPTDISSGSGTITGFGMPSLPPVKPNTPWAPLGIGGGVVGVLLLGFFLFKGGDEVSDPPSDKPNVEAPENTGTNTHDPGGAKSTVSKMREAELELERLEAKQREAMAKLKAAEEEAKREAALKAEAERQAIEAEAKRKAAEAAAAAERERELAALKKAEEEARAARMAEQAKKAEQERKAAEAKAEAERRAEQARKAEAARIAAEAEAARKAEEIRKLEEARKAAEAEAKRKAAAQAEAAKRAEEARKKLEARKALEARRAREAEAAKKAEEAKKARQSQQQREIERRKAAERKAREDAKRRREAEARRKAAAEEAARKAEAERRAAEEAAKKVEPEPTPDKKRRKRRRCGPNWCY